MPRFFHGHYLYGSWAYGIMTSRPGRVMWPLTVNSIVASQRRRRK